MKKKISVLMALCMIILLCRYSPSTYCAAKQPTLGQKWTKNTSVGTKDLLKIAYGNGTFVAVGRDGEIQFSKDGTLWKKANSKSSECLSQILWTGKIFIVLGQYSIFVSINGVTWDKVYSDTSSIDDTESLSNLVWNGKVFVTARGQYIVTSIDGKKWTTKKLEADISVEQIIWNGKSFILEATNQQSDDQYTELYFSTDGYNWNKSSNKDLHLGDMVYYNNSLYAVSYADEAGSIIVTKDCKNWRTVVSLDDYDTTVSSLSYNGNQLIITGNSDDGFIYITSLDGNKWNKIPETIDNYIETNTSILVKNQLLYVGEKVLADEPYQANAIIMQSSDGVNYKIIEEFKDILGFNDAIYAQGMYIIVGNGGAILQSKDAKSWIKLRGGKGGSGSANCNFNDVKWNGKIFAAVGSNGEVYTSVDGLKWSAKNITNKELFSVAWDGKQFLVGGENGLIFKSKDGEKWTQYKSNVNGYIYNICYNGKIYVGIQNTAPNGGRFNTPSLVNNIKLCYSSDGITWTTYNIDKDINSFTKIFWNGSKFVTFYHTIKNYNNAANFDSDDADSDSDYNDNAADAVDNADDSDEDYPVDSYLAYSQDGKTWTKKLIESDASIDGIEYNGKQFTALTTNSIDDNCNALISNDGVNWKKFSCNTKNLKNQDFCAAFIKWVNGRFVCISYTNEILISSDGIKWTYYGELPYEFYNSMDGNKNIMVIAGNNTTMFYSK